MAAERSFSGFPSFARGLARAAAPRVVGDQAACSRVERGAVLRLLREHLTHNMLLIGKSWYRQSRGIPQVRAKPLNLAVTYLKCSDCKL